MNELKHNASYEWRCKLSVSLLRSLEVTQQNAFYESVLGSSYWYFIKIESGSEILQ
ncbi:hypothetical protein [Leptospira kirschneri]|uniref:hypothetical protein n=1 Tax=Leptospira kirschneri TaxID=29507 RepID=UPI00034CB771|nr:hypothetical protein [Leptospira kirschneri]